MKDCFVISPVGASNSTARKQADQLYRFIIVPILTELGYDVVRADEITAPGIITSQIIQAITRADLVIANLAESSNNVYYEVGVRHALGKPIIHLLPKGETIIFDIAQFRLIVYDLTDLDNVEDVKRLLRQSVTRLEVEGPHFRGIVEETNELYSQKDHREIPIRVFISSNSAENADEVAKAVSTLIEQLDLKLLNDPPSEKGSWWKEWLTSTKEVLSKPEMAERLRKAERAIEMQTLHKEQANIDKLQAEALQGLISSLSHTENAAIQVGSILLIKTTTETGSQLAVRTLTQTQLSLIEKDPTILKQPDQVLQTLLQAQVAVQSTLTLDSAPE